MPLKGFICKDSFSFWFPISEMGTRLTKISDLKCKDHIKN